MNTSFGYNDEGKKIYENMEGYFYDKKGICKYINKPVGFAIWNKATGKWNSYSLPIDRKAYDETIKNYSEMLFEWGFFYGEDVQRTRQRDINFLNATMKALETAQNVYGIENLTESWEFKNGTIKEMTLSNFNQLLLAGTGFISGVYKVERYFRDGEARKCKNINEFVGEVQKIISLKIDKGGTQ